jgi:uncharacterized membrane protein YbhN (UPF0104 family)
LAQSGAKDKKRHISVILRILVAVGALYLFLRGIELGELGRILMRLNPLVVIAAIGLYVVAQAFFVLRWRILLRVLSVDISMGAGLKLHFLGLFYNNALPSSVGGDFLRAWYITKHVEDGKRLDAALSVFVDRAIGLTGMILMVLVFYLFVPVEGGLGQANASGGGDTNAAAMNGFAEYRWVLLAVVIGFAILFGACSVTRGGRRAMVKVCRKLWRILERILRKALAAAKLYSKRPLTIICGIGLTFILQSLCIIGFWLLGRNMGMEAHIKYYFVFFPMSWLIGTLPISIGGIGIMEGSLKMMFLSVSGVTDTFASAIPVCQRLIWWIGSLPGLVVHLVGAHLPTEKTDFFVDSAEDVG